jgi:hypothetical protein
MSPHSRRSSVAPRVAVLLGVVILGAAIACGDPYQHTNPYDPLVPVTVTVLGPDTLFSYREIGQYSAQSIPAFPDSAFQFGSGDSASLVPSTGGAFTSLAPPLYPDTRTVRVSALIGQIDTLIDNQNQTCPFIPPVCVGGTPCPPPPPCKIATTPSLAWRHSGSKDVVLTQRIVRIQLRCPADHACDTLSAGSAWTVWADGFDALNYQALALSGVNANPAVSSDNPVFATFAVRDPTIASLVPAGIRVATVTALKSGVTWIVGMRGALLDSLPLIVR